MAAPGRRSRRSSATRNDCSRQVSRILLKPASLPASAPAAGTSLRFPPKPAAHVFVFASCPTIRSVRPDGKSHASKCARLSPRRLCKPSCASSPNPTPHDCPRESPSVSAHRAVWLRNPRACSSTTFAGDWCVSFGTRLFLRRAHASSGMEWIMRVGSFRPAYTGRAWNGAATLRPQSSS